LGENSGFDRPHNHDFSLHVELWRRQTVALTFAFRGFFSRCLRRDAGFVASDFAMLRDFLGLVIAR
jgi:hypothetical protein